MSYEPCTFSPDMAADSWQTSSSDTGQLSLLSGMLTPAKSSESEPQTDGFQACECGKGMSDCLIHPSTPEAWTAYMRASLARMFQQPALKQELALRHAAASTAKSCASLAWFDPDSSTWRTSQQSFITGLEPFSGTWPRSGMLVNGHAYELPTAGLRTNETDGGVCFPTPTSHDAKKGAYPSEYTRNTPGIAVMLGGKPSPTFQEWQMGWPINHTALKGSGTGRFPSRPQQPGESLEGLEA